MRHIAQAVIKLAELTYQEARRVARDPKAVVLLPTGAIEQHGPHLPLMVDWLGSDELAQIVARYLRRNGFHPVLVPSLPYGVSPLAENWSGTVSLSVATFKRVIIEVPLARHGFRRFVLVNFQADPGHLKGLALAQRALKRDKRIQLFFAGFEPGPTGIALMINDRVRRLYRSPNPLSEWHSGEGETGFVLAFAPKLVRKGIARRLKPAWVNWRVAYSRGARTFEQMNPHGQGYFGWPAVARPHTGRKVMELRGRLVSEKLLRELRDSHAVRSKPSRRR